MASVEEFENKCMDVIEKIVSISPKQDRAGAIKVAQKMLENAKQTGKKDAIDIFVRVEHEFEIATDDEYNLLKKQIFKN